MEYVERNTYPYSRKTLNKPDEFSIITYPEPFRVQQLFCSSKLILAILEKLVDVLVLSEDQLRSSCRFRVEYAGKARPLYSVYFTLQLAKRSTAHKETI